jgi:hypothetical protein
MEKRQGKCGYCKVAYRWDARSDHPLKRAHCGRCGGKLQATSHLLTAYRWAEATANTNVCGIVVVSEVKRAPESLTTAITQGPEGDRTSENRASQIDGEEVIK